MMVIEGLYYTKDHEWVKVEGGTATVGVADYAQEALGEITFVELPELGREVDSHGELAVAESSKAATDIYSPIAGKVIEVNEQLESEPERINSDCYGQGWLVKLGFSAEPDIGKLMDAAEYEDFVNGLD